MTGVDPSDIHDDQLASFSERQIARTTSAGDWFQALRRGERLPEHTLPGEGIQRPKADEEQSGSIIEEE